MGCAVKEQELAVSCVVGYVVGVQALLPNVAARS